MPTKFSIDTLRNGVFSAAVVAATVACSISPSAAAGGGLGGAGGLGGGGTGRASGLGGDRGVGGDRFVVGTRRARSAGSRESRHCSPSLVERYSYGCSPLKVPYGPYGQ